MSFMTLAGAIGLGRSLLGGIAGNAFGTQQYNAGRNLQRQGFQQLGFSTNALNQSLGVLNNYDPRREAFSTFRQTGSYVDRGQIDARYSGLGGQNATYAANLYRDTMNRQKNTTLFDLTQRGTMNLASGYRDIGNSFAQNAQPLISQGTNLMEAGLGTRHNAWQDTIGGLAESGTFMLPGAENFFGLG